MGRKERVEQMIHNDMTDLSITRTALDAIQAKASAVSLLNNTRGVVDETYIDLIRRMLILGHDDGSSSSSSSSSSSNNNKNIMKQRRRQTPLVHAGYLLRIQAILSTVCNFMSIVGGGDNDNDDNVLDVTIILLGSGMDVTGLWAAQRFPNRVGHVIEIDLPTICASKREILQQQGLVDFTTSNDDDDDINIIMSSTSASLSASDETTATTSTSTTRQQGATRSIHHGTVVPQQQQPSSSSSSSSSSIRIQQQKFTLVEADLRDKQQYDDWKSVLPEGRRLWNSQASPTLVISEVVLAYLAGKEEDAVNIVLSAWATALQHNPESCLVLLEPLGGGPASLFLSDTNTAAAATPTTTGVLHSYQLAYTQMFQSKLQRGVAVVSSSSKNNNNNNNKAEDDDDNNYDMKNQQPSCCCFAPIGTSPINVARRLKNTGWGCAVAVSLAKAAASCIAASSSSSSSSTTSTSRLQITNDEPFDEHAALLLHAQSYVVACAFPAAACSSALFRRVMAPWQSTTTGILPGAPFRPAMESSSLWIATIDRTQEATVKSLFVEGYADLCKTNKSVRKLVKGAFKKAFILTKVDASNDGIDFTSNFAKYYQNRGGCFLVAMDAATRQIVGFVALCKVVGLPQPPTASSSSSSSTHHANHANNNIHSKNHHHDNSNSNNNTYFEVQRLFVVAEYRRKGVAGHLMDAVQQFGLAQSASSSAAAAPGTTANMVTFLAATLSVLHAANRFYSRRGFIKLPIDEVPLLDQDGDGMTIHNYMLQIQY